MRLHKTALGALAAIGLAGLASSWSHDHASHPLAHMSAHDHAVLADSVSLAEREAHQTAQRAMVRGLAAPTFQTSEEEHEHHLFDPAGNARTPAPTRAPVYDSKNTDGQAG